MPDHDRTQPDAFERIDVEQPSVDRVQLRLHIARYEFARGWASGRRGLDIACGTGYGTAMLAEAGATHMVGVDIDPRTIEQAGHRYGRPEISFVVGDAEQIPAAGPFGLIVSFETIEHLRNPELFLAATRDLLDPSGHFIVSSPCRHTGSLSDRPRNPFHVREWNRKEFEELLGRYFARVTVFGQLIEFAQGRLPFKRSLARLLTTITDEIGRAHV